MEEKLLEALQRGDVNSVSIYAKELLLRKDGSPNIVEISYFQSYAPCLIYPVELDKSNKRWILGAIRYGSKIFNFS